MTSIGVAGAAALALVCLTACSTVETSGLAQPVVQNLSQERFQLRVRTGNEQMDRLVYEFVYEQFGGTIPLREKEPYTGSLDITFTSTTQSGFLGTSTSAFSANGTSYGWYTGGVAHVSGTSTSISTGTFLEWQNSTMLAVLRRADGERLWTADYNYKGGWEMSGWVVNTPDEAARLVAKRLKARFIADRDGKHK